MTEQDEARGRVNALLNLIEKAEAHISGSMEHCEVGFASLMELKQAVNNARDAFQIQFPQDTNARWQFADGSIWRPNNAKLS